MVCGRRERKSSTLEGAASGLSSTAGGGGAGYLVGTSDLVHLVLEMREKVVPIVAVGDSNSVPGAHQHVASSVSIQEEGGDSHSEHRAMDPTTAREDVERRFDALLKRIRKDGRGGVASYGSSGVSSSSASHTGGTHYSQSQQLPSFHTGSSSTNHHPVATGPGRSLGRGFENTDFGLDEDDEDDIDGDEDEEPPIARSSDEDGGSEDLDAFSGLEDILSDDDDMHREAPGPDLKRKKPNQREYAPNGRKQRGYHKWAGLSVALLSTGETGIVLKKLGGRIKVRLDHNPSIELSSAEEKLHLMEHHSGPEAVEEIYEAAKFVPQWKDLKIGQRVAMLRFDNATGRVVRLPDEKRALGGLGHVVVQLDLGGGQKKAVLETLRMIDEGHPVVPYTEVKQKTLGRPTKADVARKTSPPPIQPVVPYSKRGDAWRSSLRPPSGSISPPQSPAPTTIVPKYSGRNEDDAKRHRKEDGSDDDRSSSRRGREYDNHGGNKPLLTRGKKLCRSCGAVIGTACRTCSSCGKPCAKSEKH